MNNRGWLPRDVAPVWGNKGFGSVGKRLAQRCEHADAASSDPNSPDPLMELLQLIERPQSNDSVGSPFENPGGRTMNRSAPSFLIIPLLTAACAGSSDGSALQIAQNRQATSEEQVASLTCNTAVAAPSGNTDCATPRSLRMVDKHPLARLDRHLPN